MDARLKHSGMTFFGTFIRLNTYLPGYFVTPHFKMSSWEPTSKTISGKTILLVVLPVIVLHFVFCFKSKDFTFKILRFGFPARIHIEGAAL
jgi:hypothetical protein